VARRSRSILDDLILLPWWINLILAVVVYFLFKYVVPTITFQNPFLKGIALALPSFAHFAAVILLFVAAISAFNAWRKGKMLDGQKGLETIRSISWREFEELVGEAYRRKGYSVTETGGGGADGGVDLVLRKDGDKLLVQCKHWKIVKVGVKVVRELYGVVAAEGATGGIVISSGTFTQEAKDFAKDKPLELVDGSGLLKLIAEVQRSPMHLPSKSNGITCPSCGVEMVLRTAKKGPNAGEKFWGCSNFPKCNATKPYKT
jgi:restriction system protein